MNTQLSILDQIDNDAFRKYHETHPEVYKTFVRLTRITKNKGFKRFSARGIFQVMRWQMGGRIKEDGYKFNNNYTPYYVRLLEYEYPEFIGFYEKRKVTKPELILNT